MILSNYQFELTRPAYLGSLLVLLWIVYCYYRSLVDLQRWQRVASTTIRVAVIVLLVLALAGLNLLSPTKQQFVVVAVDESLSVAGPSLDLQNEYLRQIRAATVESQVVYLPFAAHPGQVSAAFSPLDDPVATDSDEVAASNEKANGAAADSAQDKSRLGTNLAAAIEAAAAALPPFYVPQVFLLSDGNQTQGDAIRAAVSAAVPIHTIPLPPRSEPEVQVSDVVVPAEVRQGEPFYVEVVVNSNHDDEGMIEIYRGDVRIEGQEAKKYTITTGENHFRFRQEVSDQRLVSYTARISGFQDHWLDNNMASGLVSAAGQPRVLLIDSDIKTTDPLRWALEEQEIRVDVRPPEGVPDGLSELQNYEVVILSNVPATALTIRQMQVLRTYVQDLGSGLVMIGGDQSFGLGGYYKTTLEEILPVRSDFENEKEKPSLAMVFVIDRSGSMTGEKMELAKDAAKSAIELLGPRDQVGVVAFDNSAYWVSELHSANDKAYVADRISSIESGGGTNIYPALSAAYEALSRAVAKLKHVVLLSDGQTSPGDFEGVVARMIADRITVSTVGVGDGADTELLQSIAKQGNGRYYYCDDPASIPQIFAKETVTAGKSAMNEQPFVPQWVRASPVLSSLDIESAPFLLGFVSTRPKPTSEFILSTETGEPLLIWWRYGLGMTVAFTSDAQARWAAEWLTWPNFSTFWAQVVRHSMRKGDAQGLYTEIERQGDRTEIRLDAVDAAGQFRNDAETHVTVIGPRIGAEKIEVEMQQVAPGRYVAKVDTDHEGAYHLEVSQVAGGETLRQTRGLVVGYPEELRLRPMNETLLRRIAEVSGGRFTTHPTEILESEVRTAHRAEPLWPLLCACAMSLFLADVALRRIDFSLFR